MQCFLCRGLRRHWLTSNKPGGSNTTPSWPKVGCVVHPGSTSVALKTTPPVSFTVRRPGEASSRLSQCARHGISITCPEKNPPQAWLHRVPGADEDFQKWQRKYNDTEFQRIVTAHTAFLYDQAAPPGLIFTR